MPGREQQSYACTDASAGLISALNGGSIGKISAMASIVSDPVEHPGRFTDLYTFHWNETSFRTSMVGVVAVATALVGGVAAGHPSAGLIAGGGAMTIGFGMNQKIADSRLWPMIAATLAMTFSTFVGMFAGHHGYSIVVAAALWSFVYGMLTARAPGVAWVGMQAAVTLMVTSAFPADAFHAFLRSLLTLTGGVLQIGFSSMLLHLLPELSSDLRYIPHYGLRRVRRFQHSVGWHRLWRRVRGFPRALPRLRASPSVMFALRMALTVAVATEIYRWRGVQSGYWIPMTAMMVQKPLFAETLSRALTRVIGTLAGAVLATLFLLFIHPDPMILAWITVGFTFLSYLTVSINYALFSAFITSYIVFLLSLNALPGPEIAHRRAYATVVGGVVALLIHLDALRRKRGGEPGPIA